MQAAAPIALGLKVAGGIQQGNAAMAAGRANKRIADANARGLDAEGVARVAASRDQVRQYIGKQLASQGASGFQMGTGSPADLIRESQINGMLEVLNIRQQYQSAADAERFRGRVALMTGRNQQIGAYFGAAGALAGGAADYAGAS